MGLVLCYRAYAATFVWGGALALAVVLPYRCKLHVRGATASMVLVVAAVAAGAGAPQFAIPAIVYVACAVRATRRTGAVPRWMWAPLAGLVAGFALAAAQAPYIEIAKVALRGLEPNLGLLAMPLREGRELIRARCRARVDRRGRDRRPAGQRLDRAP